MKPRAAKRCKAMAPIDYAPGHFTALIRRHNWPPMWQPFYQFDGPEADRSAIASASREKLLSAGITGTIRGLSAKSEAMVSRLGIAGHLLRRG